MPELINTPPASQKRNHLLLYVLVIFAILLSVGGIVFGLHNMHETLALGSNPNDQQSKQVAELRQQAQSLQSSLSTLQSTLTATQQDQAQQIGALQKDLVGLDKSHAIQSQRVFAEIAYLIHIANAQLTLEHQKTAAINTLSLAEQTILVSNDTQFDSLKQVIGADLATLRSAPNTDTSSLFSQLTALIQQVQQLTTLPSEQTLPTQNTTTDAAAEHSWINAVKTTVFGGIKKLFVIRREDQAATPLLEPTQENYLKQNITGQLVMAQWALLHRNPEIFNDSLKLAQEWITQYFPASDNNAVVTSLSQLREVTIDPSLPSIDNTLFALTETDNSLRAST